MPPNNCVETFWAAEGVLKAKERERTVSTKTEQRRREDISSKFPHTCRLHSIKLHPVVNTTSAPPRAIGWPTIAFGWQLRGCGPARLNTKISTWMSMRLKFVLLSLLLAVPAINIAQTQNVDTKTLTEMRWRNVGPFRGGRTRALSGVPGQPNVFYVGAVNGGVWKSTDYGRTWQPIFDQQPTGSIGAIVVAPSDPQIVYVGSGEGLHRPDLSVGDGIYKSTDAGKTWTHLGLRDGQQIPQLAVDPHDPNKVFAAVAGHPYGPNQERGVYRSTDGGATFEK